MQVLLLNYQKNNLLRFLVPLVLSLRLNLRLARGVTAGLNVADRRYRRIRHYFGLRNTDRLPIVTRQLAGIAERCPANAASYLLREHTEGESNSPAR